MARLLNALMGCSVFTAWNVGGIPYEDWLDIKALVRMSSDGE